MKKIITDLQLVTLPIVILIVILGLFIISGKIMIDNISRLSSERSEDNKNLQNLQTKLSSLQNTSPVLAANSQTATLALPITDSVLSAIALITQTASNNNLTVDQIQTTNVSDVAATGINSTQIGFVVEGDYTSVSQFVLDIKNSTPIIRFDSIKIDNATGPYVLTADIFAYWAPLPSTLPDINKPIEALTPDEQETITQIIPNPAFITNASTSAEVATSSGKVNPFQ